MRVSYLSHRIKFSLDYLSRSVSSGSLSCWICRRRWLPLRTSVDTSDPLSGRHFADFGAGESHINASKDLSFRWRRWGIEAGVSPFVPDAGGRAADRVRFVRRSMTVSGRPPAETSGVSRPKIGDPGSRPRPSLECRRSVSTQRVRGRPNVTPSKYTRSTSDK